MFSYWKKRKPKNYIYIYLYFFNYLFIKEKKLIGSDGPLYCSIKWKEPIFICYQLKGYKMRFDWGFGYNFVNFKDFVIVFWNLWVIYGSWKSWSVVFASGKTNDSQFAIPNRLFRSLFNNRFNLVGLCPNEYFGSQNQLPWNLDLEWSFGII